MIKRLNVSIEINGKQELVGFITGESYMDARFCYASDYIVRQGIRPISISLPLQEESFSVEVTKSYFEALLPEGFSRRAVANWTKTSEEDYLAILARLGQESLGAIKISSENEVVDSHYQLLSSQQVQALAAEGATKSTEIMVETHLSLTGASGKVGLYYNQEEDAWYLPLGGAASTHIVKQSHVRLSQIVINEQLCMMTARLMGIDVPESFIINMGEGRDQDILYATKRYDRKPSMRMVDVMKLPYRLHQEDFGQAMGIPSSAKYELEKQGYLKKMFDLVRNYSSNPVEDLLKLWDRVVFNYLIGNTDSHIKNYSFLYSEDMSSLRLAPAYDIVRTIAYPGAHKMSYYIGDELDIDKIDRASFAMAAREVGLGEKLAMKRFDYMADNISAAYKKAADELKGMGYVFKEDDGK